MGKEPNTVKSKVVGTVRNFSAQESQLEFQPSDFHDDTDSAILVRERTKGSKLEPTFARKAGTVIQKRNIQLRYSLKRQNNHKSSPKEISYRKHVSRTKEGAKETSNNQRDLYF